MTTYLSSFFVGPTIDLLIQHHPSIWFYPFNHPSPIESLSMVLKSLLTGRQVRRFIYQRLERNRKKQRKNGKGSGVFTFTFLVSNIWSVWCLGFHLPTMSSWEKEKKKEVEQLFFLSLWSVKHRNVSLCLLWRRESLALRGLGHLVIESFNFFCSRCFLCSGHGFGLSQTERERDWIKVSELSLRTKVRGCSLPDPVFSQTRRKIMMSCHLFIRSEGPLELCLKGENDRREGDA